MDQFHGSMKGIHNIMGKTKVQYLRFLVMPQLNSRVKEKKGEVRYFKEPHV